MDLDLDDSREELMRRVGTYEWVHSIDLGGGIVTPGRWGPPPSFLLRAMDDIPFAGASVLDIGCWDGLWSFEAERRGATEVYATDNLPHRNHPDQPTFRLAHRALRSRVKYVPDLDVYDAPRIGKSDFDVVLFLGVYYHLKHPLLALSRLRRCLRDGALILVEGEVLPGDEPVAQFHYHEPYKNDVSNWWIPSVRVLREWVECSFFRIRHEYRPDDGTRTRHAILAEAVSGHDPNYAYPDAELAAFDRNRYQDG